MHTRCRSEEWSADTLLLTGQKLAWEAQTDRHTDAHTGGQVAPRGGGEATSVCTGNQQPNVILPIHYYKKHKYKQALQKYIYKTNM